MHMRISYRLPVWQSL